ncbi:MAG: family 20 glycosylhydrolase, partial [Kiritimatiellae bacterium]|nr:family 20 glycosylhydrolase [Kiritimatiellia bacterium]MDW8458804.1 glycoside hydrolase family 20 zincin-like fold domain-containing protein [Verrucomicrobiota bacterium]
MDSRSAPPLLPRPRRYEPEQGGLSLQSRHVSILSTEPEFERTAQRIRADLRRELHLEATLRETTGKPGGASIVLRKDPSQPAQGYRLHITRRQITIEAHDAAGAYYGALTLRQLVRIHRDALPACWIEDFPDFPVRGVMLDISRDKVPTMETLFRLIEELAEWKINRFELYTEHSFAYRNHRAVWEHASPITAEEARELDAFCAERFVELVPNQNCFGHLHRWLEKEPYRHLAECPDGFMTPWGEWRPGPFSLNPLDPGSIALVEELLTELVQNFRSSNLNVGCDETFDLGQGRSREACEARGKGRVYLEFLTKIYAIVVRLGRRMNFWGDIVLNHPELIPELPRDVVPLVWGYEADHPFAAQCAPFAESGLNFLVCPGTSGWNSLLGRTDNALANMENAAENGLAAGAAGMLITAWGDNGHLQPYAVELLPLAAGAARAWCLQSNRHADLAAQLDAQVFRDDSRIYGRLAGELGTLYRLLEHPVFNASALFRLLSQRDISTLQTAIGEPRLRAARNRLRELRAELARTRSRRDDAELLLAEW